MGTEHMHEMSEEHYESSIPSDSTPGSRAPSLAPWAGLDGIEEEEEGAEAQGEVTDAMQTMHLSPAWNGVTEEESPVPAEGTERENEIYRKGQWIYRGERQGDDNTCDRCRRRNEACYRAGDRACYTCRSRRQGCKLRGVLFRDRKMAASRAENSSSTKQQGPSDVRPSKRIKLEPRSEAVLPGGSDRRGRKVREFIIEEIATALQDRMESLGKLLRKNSGKIAVKFRGALDSA